MLSLLLAIFHFFTERQRYFFVWVGGSADPPGSARAPGFPLHTP